MRSFLRMCNSKLKAVFKEEWSYRSEAGVKLLVDRNGRASVDFDDEQTREIFRKQLEKYKDVKIEGNGYD